MIRVDFSELRKLAEEIAEKAEDLRPALESIAEEALVDLQEDFDRARSAEGPWVPLADRSGRKPLHRTGRLKRSLTAKVGNRKITLASDSPYARFHQYGTSTIPARPFLAVRDERVGEAVRKIVAHIMKGDG